MRRIVAGSITGAGLLAALAPASAQAANACSKSRKPSIGIRGHNGDLARSTPTLAATCN